MFSWPILDAETPSRRKAAPPMVSLPVVSHGEGSGHGVERGSLRRSSSGKPWVSALHNLSRPAWHAVCALLLCLMAPGLAPQARAAELSHPQAPVTDPARKAFAVGTLTAGFAATGVWTYLAWYKDAPRHPFRIEQDGWFGANTYAGGADKLGHAYGSNLLFRGTAGVLDAAGLTETESTIWGALLTLTFFTMIEVKDAYHYSFSTHDLAFDALGILWGAASRHWPGLRERLTFQLQYFPSDAYLARGNWSYNIAEDYSGQTFVLAYHLASLPSPGALRWVDLTFGYRATGYLPEPLVSPKATQQTMLVGIGLNLAELNRALPGDAPVSNIERAAGATTRFLITHLRPPGTTLWFAP